MTRLTFRYGDKTVVAGFKKAEGSPLGFSNLGTHSWEKEVGIAKSVTVKVTGDFHFEIKHSKFQSPEDMDAINQKCDDLSEAAPYPGVTLSSSSELLSRRHGMTECTPAYGYR